MKKNHIRRARMSKVAKPEVLSYMESEVSMWRIHDENERALAREDN